VDERQYAKTWRDAVVNSSTGMRGATRGFLRHAALSVLARASRGATRPFLRCIYCHYVFDDQRREFEELMRKLQRLGTFVSTDACVSMLTGQRSIDGPYFHLSFDDGLRNCYTNAFPILKRLGIPAIVFVPAAMVGADFERTRRFCRETTHYANAIELMRWDDLTHMISSGYEVGSHSSSHARLTALAREPSILDEELRGSKHILETRLGVPCDFIAWPYGKVDEAALAVGRNAGYKAGFSAFRGRVVPGTTDAFRIPRHHFEPQWPPLHVEYFASGHMEASRTSWLLGE
jgi:peptidoglycan/xylan/chitin deacetylase (PgdA/CDA1 family)